MMDNVISLADHRRQRDEITLDDLALELGLDPRGLWAALVVKRIVRKRRGDPERDPRDDAVALLLVVRTAEEIDAAADRIDARRRGPAGRGRAA